MDQEHDIQQWLLKAAADLRRVTAAETRFSAAMSMNHVTMLAAADELEAATREAMAWMRGNPCPDREVGGRVGLMLSTCAEVAATAERALTDPCDDIEAVFGRLGDLLAIIDFHSETLKTWWQRCRGLRAMARSGLRLHVDHDGREGEPPAVLRFRRSVDPASGAVTVSGLRGGAASAPQAAARIGREGARGGRHCQPAEIRCACQWTVAAVVPAGPGRA